MGVLYKTGAADSIVIPGLVSQADTKLLITNPTIAAGDVKIWNSGTSAWDNLATTPTALSATGTAVLISWSATEAAYSPFVIVWQDAAGAQWCSGGLSIRMGARDIADLAYPTTTGRSIDVLATGEVGIDWGNIANQNNSATLSNTTIKAVTDDVTVGSIDAGAITAAAIATGAIDADALATDAVTEIVDAVWVHDSRTLTQGAASVVSAVTGSDISVYLGADWSISLTGLPSDMTTYTEAYFTIKYAPGIDADANCILQIKKSATAADDGIKILMGETTGFTRTNGDMTFPTATTATITLDAIESAMLEEGAWWYDIKGVSPTGTALSEGGKITLTWAVTRATS